MFTFFLFLPQNVPGSKAGSYKGDRIASTPQHKESNETATKVPLWDGQSVIRV